MTISYLLMMDPISWGSSFVSKAVYDADKSGRTAAVHSGSPSPPLDAILRFSIRKSKAGNEVNHYTQNNRKCRHLKSFNLKKINNNNKWRFIMTSSNPFPDIFRTDDSNSTCNQKEQVYKRRLFLLLVVFSTCCNPSYHDICHQNCRQSELFKQHT